MTQKVKLLSPKTDMIFQCLFGKKGYYIIGVNYILIN